MFSFSFVYLGALHRHKYHGMQRIDYTLILEYDNSVCKYFFHIITMIVVRVVMISLFFLALSTGPQLLIEQKGDQVGYFL
jgi:hypothetical protein